MQKEINKAAHIKEEALAYFTKHYPRASKNEIDKQVEDWQNKINSGQALVEFFENRVGKVQAKRVLDVGFGSGGIVVAFNQAGALVSGVDINPELKIIAERVLVENGAKADLQIYNGTDLPYGDNYFDYIVSSSVLEHVSTPEKLLNEMLRVLKVGGRIFLSLPNKYYPFETHTLAYFVSYMPHSLANWYLKLLKRSSLEDDNLHFYSYFDIIKMLKKSNFKYDLVYKDLSQISAIKKIIINTLKKLGVHYTIFLKQLIFIIEKK